MSDINAGERAARIDSAPDAQFESISKRTHLLSGILVASMVLGIIAFFSDFALTGLIRRAMGGGLVTEPELTTISNVQSAIWPLQIVVTIAYVVVFFMWVYRANKNLGSLHATGQRFTPGWAIGWFFVPIMNFFRPYQVLSEIWRASDPRADTTDNTSWKTMPTSPIVGCWFAFYLVSFFVARIVIQSIPSATELSDLLNAAYVSVLYDGVNIIFVLITIFMVRRIGQFQEAKNVLLDSGYRDTMQPSVARRIVL